MSFLNKLAGLPASLKESWKKTFGDVDVPLDVSLGEVGADDGDAGVVRAPRAQISLEQAWGVVGVAPAATLDDVRAAARARGRALHARVVSGDVDTDEALAQLIAASDLIEEHLLPALRGSAPVASSAAPTTTSSATAPTTTPPRGGRQRATPRAT
jgi:hypothetical protein